VTKLQWIATGQRFRLARLAIGLSEADAATACGIPLRSYQGYEAGKRQRSMIAACKFSESFDVSLDWLFHGDTSRIRRHLAKGSIGKVAILPFTGKRNR
jgi:transcriptional regulator with XRE-family HTH domain